jgi:chromatin remodeling complex protein RSC6
MAKSSKSAKGARKGAKGAAKSAKTARSAKAGGAKKSAKKGGGRQANAAFMRPVQPSETLAEVVGSAPLPRTELTKKLWAYIKKNGLQDQKNKRMIKADDKLKAVFGKPQVNMFEMTKLVNKHVK